MGTWKSHWMVQNWVFYVAGHCFYWGFDLLFVFWEHESSCGCKQTAGSSGLWRERSGARMPPAITGCYTGNGRIHTWEISHGPPKPRTLCPRRTSISWCWKFAAYPPKLKQVSFAWNPIFWESWAGKCNVKRRPAGRLLTSASNCERWASDGMIHPRS